MIFDSGTWWVVLIIVGAITSSLTYLLKLALFTRIDKVEKRLSDVIENHLSKDEYEKNLRTIRDDIETIKTNYTTKDSHMKDFDECRNDIKKIKEDYITKEDFFREQGKTDRKLDKILDILLNAKGSRNE